MSVPHEQASQSAFQPAPSARPAGWVVGMSAFAVVMMVMIGIFHVVEGLAALFTNEVYLVGVQYVFSFDLSTWGWVHLLLGILVIAAGVGVRTGTLGRNRPRRDQHDREFPVPPVLPGVVVADHCARLLRHLGAVRLQRGRRAGMRAGPTQPREPGGSVDHPPTTWSARRAARSGG